jgi:Icc-related predicted phosphoesterase
MAVLSDIHSDYDALRAAVRHINADTSIHLAVIAGDLTQFGPQDYSFTFRGAKLVFYNDNVMEEHQVRLAIHGHEHNYHLENLEGGRTLFLVAEGIGDRNYAKVEVAGDSLSVERTCF